MTAPSIVGEGVFYGCVFMIIYMFRKMYCWRESNGGGSINSGIVTGRVGFIKG